VPLPAVLTYSSTECHAPSAEKRHLSRPTSTSPVVHGLVMTIPPPQVNPGQCTVLSRCATPDAPTKDFPREGQATSPPSPNQSQLETLYSISTRAPLQSGQLKPDECAIRTLSPLDLWAQRQILNYLGDSTHLQPYLAVCCGHPPQPSVERTASAASEK
jgi:hypothetical protein